MRNTLRDIWHVVFALAFILIALWVFGVLLMHLAGPGWSSL
jgi:hypothetical protein